MKLLTKWLLSAAALLAVAYLYSGVQVSSFGAALIASLVIGLFNMLLRPNYREFLVKGVQLPLHLAGVVRSLARSLGYTPPPSLDNQRK